MGISTESKPHCLKRGKSFTLALVKGEVKRKVFMPKRMAWFSQILPCYYALPPLHEPEIRDKARPHPSPLPQEREKSQRADGSGVQCAILLSGNSHPGPLPRGEGEASPIYFELDAHNFNLQSVGKTALGEKVER